MVLDFYEMGKAVESTIAELDHHHLGTWERLGAEEEYRTWGVSWLPMDFNSTSENLLYEIAKRLPLHLPWVSLTLHETCTTTAVLTRAEFIRTASRRGE
jgi:6-pyruvoyl-tetrahydropterin synthase